MNPLLLLSVYNHIHLLSEACVKHAQYLWQTLVDAYTIKTHIFFQGIASPYSSSTVHTRTRGSATPLWHYRADTKTFVEWSNQFQGMADAEAALQQTSLPILSMTIVDGEEVIHDLTEFIGPIRVFHSTPKVSPSIAHIIAAWSMSSGIVLHPSNNYLANTITNFADTVAIAINSHEYLNVVLASREADTSVSQST